VGSWDFPGDRVVLIPSFPSLSTSSLQYSGSSQNPACFGAATKAAESSDVVAIASERKVASNVQRYCAHMVDRSRDRSRPAFRRLTPLDPREETGNRTHASPRTTRQQLNDLSIVAITSICLPQSPSPRFLLPRRPRSRPLHRRQHHALPCLRSPSLDVMSRTFTRHRRNR
jgi:hypothetical protein